MATTRVPLTEISPNRLRGAELSDEHRLLIYGRWLDGQSLGAIARAEKLSKSAVQGVIERLRTRGHASTAARPGGPKKRTARDERAIVNAARRNPSLSYRQIAVGAGVEFSRETIKHVLDERGITSGPTKGHQKRIKKTARRKCRLNLDDVNMDDPQLTTTQHRRGSAVEHSIFTTDDTVP